MGLFDFVKKQFVDIIQWMEEDDNVLVWRFPIADAEIQQGAQLTVRETQVALFVHQGQAADLFGPGQHTIRTQNIPILTDLQHWDKMFESPFKSDVYFFSTRLRLNQTWGTSNPITIREKEFGAIRLRTFGIYAYKIDQPKVFFPQVSGTRGVYTVADLEGQLRNTIVATLTDHFAESGIPFLDMAANQEELGKAVGEKVKPKFAELGLSLENFQVQNVSLPEELQKRLDERIGMGVVGDLGRYTQFQTAQSIPIAAAAEGGAAGAGVGLGAGIAMGQAMGQAMTQTLQGGAGAATAAASCVKCAKPIAVGAKFCPECGTLQTLRCLKCNVKLDRPAKFCPECGAPQS